MTIQLYYWPGLPGRGEFVRLALEAAGVDYVDHAQSEDGEALIADLQSRTGFAPFAPPYIDDGEVVIAQVAHILTYLAEKHGFGAGDLPTDLALIQLQLTVTDIVAEAHDTHHPVDTNAYYDEQKDEAARKAKAFREQRIPKYLDHFEAALAVKDGPFTLGERWSHVDTSLFQLREGLYYAFPKRMAELATGYPRVAACRDAVAALPGIAAYLKSERRQDFNEDGIFRHYPELDGEVGDA